MCFFFPFTAHTHCLHFPIIYSFNPPQAGFTTWTLSQRAPVSSVCYPGLLWHVLLCWPSTFSWNVHSFGFHNIILFYIFGHSQSLLMFFLHRLFFFHQRLWAFLRAQTSALPISTSAQVSSIPIVPSITATQKTLRPQFLVLTLAVFHPTILVFWQAPPAFTLATLSPTGWRKFFPSSSLFTSSYYSFLWNVSYTVLPFHFHR